MRIKISFLTMVLFGAICFLGSQSGAEDIMFPIVIKKGNYAPVEKTGLTSSYRNHDDGDLQKGVAWPTPRFSDNSDGTVTDNLTGLVWLKDANCASQSLDWNNAIDYSAALYDGCEDCFGTTGDCGLSDGSLAGDWRLPSVKELQSLIDYAYYTPALSNAAGTGKWTSGDAFDGVESTYYWSSTTYAVYTPNACFVCLGYGDVDDNHKDTLFRVWPVRDPK